jgi:tRNA dimethylallyltransferase
MSRERAVDLAKRDTRRYAKRQFTWIAGQMRAWPKSTDFALTPRLETIFALLGGVDGALSVN